MPPPKAILFDIGGVVVLSPFQAILDYEKENNIPIGYINFAIQKGPPQTGAWQLIERGEVELNDAWFTSFKAQLQHPRSWEEFQRKKNPSGIAAADSNSIPEIDAEALFWRMMRISRSPDPHMYPALHALRQSGKFVLGALSNTIAFPPGIRDEKGILFNSALIHSASPFPSPSSTHQYSSTNLRDCFDVFISSAHVGLRKPDARIYELAVRELSRVGVERGVGEICAGEVVFLDDIGGNLKGARECGLRTIKVGLGKGEDAVRELEDVVGMDLLGGGEEGRRKRGSRL